MSPDAIVLNMSARLSSKIRSTYSCRSNRSHEFRAHVYGILCELPCHLAMWIHTSVCDVTSNFRRHN